MKIELVRTSLVFTQELKLHWAKQIYVCPPVYTLNDNRCVNTIVFFIVLIEQKSILEKPLFESCRTHLLEKGKGVQ